MRQQYHFRPSKDGQLSWDVIRLIQQAKDLPVIDVPLSRIQELDESFWYDLGGAQPTCRNIVEHIQLIHQTDLTYPIILCYQGRVMDGMHRVCKALLSGHSTIKAVQFSHYLPPDYIGVEADQLPYGDRPDNTGVIAAD